MLNQTAKPGHIALAAILVLLLLALIGWRLLRQPAPPPSGPAPAGTQPRLRDAPEGPPMGR
jgi:hypothetical protein